MDHEKLNKDLKGMTELLMMKDDLDFKAAKRQALLEAWKVYMPEGENSEDNELKRWIVKTWKVLLPGGGVPEEKELPVWLQLRIANGRDQAKADQERANGKIKDPAAIAKELKEIAIQMHTALNVMMAICQKMKETNTLKNQDFVNRKSPQEGGGSGEVSRQPATIFENKHFDNSVHDKSSQSN